MFSLTSISLNQGQKIYFIGNDFLGKNTFFCNDQFDYTQTHNQFSLQQLFRNYDINFLLVESLQPVESGQMGKRLKGSDRWTAYPAL